MKAIVRHIEYLLQSHDCVIVPGIGAILCHGEPAAYDAQAGMWKAPRRVLSFNPELSRTDGLLAMSVARRNGISVEAAAARVSSATAAMRTELDSAGRLSLGSAGDLMRTPAGPLNYIPGTARWLSPATLWLPDLRMEPLATASGLAHEAERAEVRRNGWRTAVRRTAAAASIVVGVLALAWVVRTAMPGAAPEQFASVGPAPASSVVDVPGRDRTPLVLVVTRTPEREPVETVVAEAAEEPDAERVAVAAKPAPAAVDAALAESVAPAPVRLNESDHYFLIVASLSSHDEAEAYVRKHNNFNLGILTVDGRFRVYVATGQSSAAALAAKRGAIARQYPDSWVCRR